METSDVVNIFLLLFAVTMFTYLISLKIKNNNLEKYVEDEYSGAAKNPDKLADPSDDALNELEKLLEKY
ncbi:hypothetical protein OAR30_01805 [Euryarchaeota archaeon]|jgi:hypothetical protein|nr:hypothetical protein [Euryarchaeota archaeon]MDC0852430.1 hypothetical protein [Euryarchaeota archaeon]MDC0963119.1 hypothetical protein [Euryarchaeota archaeon]MDC1029311.1 hypothetical protein [Euryarchaeota archaeon]|tara:strand:+ start:103 stop:309 length:207 start_codon:yes stop_codon:yes gene_type:complete